MPTEQSKLYRSNIQIHPITVNGTPQSIDRSEYYNQSRQFTPTKNLQYQASLKNIRINDMTATQQCTKQSLPFLNLKQIQNTSFMSIDDAYLNPRFNRPLEPKNNRILNKNLTDLQSDTESIGGRSIKTHQAQDQYYKYWKMKAHQYLDENFRLREENKKIKTQLETIQKQKATEQIQNNNVKPQNQTQTLKRDEKSFTYLENIFKKKMNELENEVKQKNQKIIILQDKLLELNRKLLGQQQRTNLIERLRKQIDTLTQQNISLKKLSYQTQKKNDQQQQIDSKVRSPYSRFRSKQKNYLSNQRSPQKIGVRKPYS